MHSNTKSLILMMVNILSIGGLDNFTTFELILVAKHQDTVIEQSLTLIEQS